MNIQWHIKHFNELNTQELYRILEARIQVFVVEQKCPYPDIDGKDSTCHHLWAEDGVGRILAYCRIVPPDISYPNQSAIGRVLSTELARGKGLGKILMLKAIEYTLQRYPQHHLRIGAQHYLEKFYQSLGFQTVSDVYIEDNIPHIDMVFTGK